MPAHVRRRYRSECHRDQIEEQDPAASPVSFRALSKMPSLRGFGRRFTQTRQHFLAVEIDYFFLVALPGMNMNAGRTGFKKLRKNLHVNFGIRPHWPTFGYFFQ